MPVPFARPVTLTAAEQQQLEILTRAHSTPQALAMRCRLILRAGTPDHPSNLRIATEFHCDRHTVGLWRTRYLAQGLAGLHDAPRAGRPRRFSPSQRVHVVSLATEEPRESPCRSTSWSLDTLATTFRHRFPRAPMSRATIWRLLDAADLKPHQSAYWLNSHDPYFASKADTICQLYVNAVRFHQEGRLVICMDEKTGMQILQRRYPTKRSRPGQRAKREYEYIRHGTRNLLASFVVPTGHVLWNVRLTRTRHDFVAHLQHVMQQLPVMTQYDWIVDNLNTHWSLDACELVAQWCGVPFLPETLQYGEQRRAFLQNPSHRHVFHFTPIHGSWLNQVELWFAVFTRQCLKQGDCASGEEFAARLGEYMEVYNTHQAHPYRWTYTGQPLVRATPFSRTRRQQQLGRAWFSPRPKRFECVFYPPRPYKRKAA
jgi:transposase